MPSPQDIENIQERLAAHRATLATLLTQQANHGSANAPPVVAHGIREARTGIHHAKATLRTWGVSVEDLLDDTALQAPQPEPPPHPANIAAPNTTLPLHEFAPLPVLKPTYVPMPSVADHPALNPRDPRLVTARGLVVRACWADAVAAYESLMLQGSLPERDAANLERARREYWLQQTRAQAEDAESHGDWPTAVELWRAIIARYPDHADLTARLQRACAEQSLAEQAQDVEDLVAQAEWEAVLAMIAEMDRQRPGYTHPRISLAAVRQQAQSARISERAVEQAEQGDWAGVIATLTNHPFVMPPETQALLIHAQEAEAQRRQRERLAPVVAQIHTGAFDQALTHVDALLVKTPTDHAATALAARIIETPAAPFAERLRAAELVGRVGDPRFPVAAEQWRAELSRRNTDFGKPAGYWCFVREGAYRIGGWASNEPSATIQIPAFWIARYPLTVAQYAPFVAEGYGVGAERWWNPEGWAWRQKSQRTQPWGWERPEYHRPNQPVIGVTWYEVTAFCAWLSAQVLPAGYVLRLPTEAEWEAAAAYDGSGQRRLYPWGNADPTPDLAIYDSGGQKKLSSVGCCPAGASACGALDLAGNVWELTASEYRAYPDGSHQPQKDFTDGWTAWRGGSWYNNSSYVRCGARYSYDLYGGGNNYGFRVVLAPRLAH